MSINESTPADPTEFPDEATPRRSTSDKIKSGAYIAKCVIIGGVFVVGGIAAVVSGTSAWWAGLIAIAYGCWLLSGVATGGWRLFIY